MNDFTPRFVSLSLTAALCFDLTAPCAYAARPKTTAAVDFSLQALAEPTGTVLYPEQHSSNQMAKVRLNRITRREFTQAAAGAVPFVTDWFWREPIRQDPDLKVSVPKEALTLPMGIERPNPQKSVPYMNIEQGNIDGVTGGMGNVTLRRRHMLWAHPYISNPTDKVYPESAISIFEKDSHGVWVSPLVGYPASEKSRLLATWDWARGLIRERSAKMHAFHPVTQYEYPPAPDKATAVTVRTFSPLIPGDAQTTALPIVITQVQLENTSSEAHEVSVIIPAPNIVGSETKFVDPFEQLTPAGSRQTYKKESESNYKGIVMGLKPGLKAPDDRLAGQMAIFVEQQPGMRVEYTLFSAEDGSLVWDTFSRTGHVRDLKKVPPPVGQQQAAAVVVRVKLKAGERRTINSSVANAFPHDVRNEKHFLRNYTKQFGTDGYHAQDIAVYGLKHQAAWSKAIQVWQENVLSAPNVPDYVKTTALNELYFLFGGGTMYTREGHIYFLEGPDPRLLNTLDVWFYTPMLAQFFPTLEQDILLGFSDQVPVEDPTLVGYINPFVATSADGKDLTHSKYGGDLAQNLKALADPNRPFDIHGLYKGFRKVAGAVGHHRDGDADVLGPVSTNPTIDNYYGRTINRHLQNHNTWKDLSPKFVLLGWRAYAMDPSKRKDFLEKIWPSVILTLQHQKEFDLDGDGLPDHMGFPDWTYDDWAVKGPTTYTAILTMEALQAAMAIAHELGKDNDPHIAEYQAWLEKGKKSIEDKLWNAEFKYFNIAEGNDDIMADAMAGILYAKEFGLERFGGPVVSDEQVRSHLQHVYDNNFLKFESGQRGIINGMKRDGTPTKGGIQSAEVWIGTQRMIAALMLRMGMKSEADRIMKTDYDNLLRDGKFLDQTPEAITFDGKFRFSTYMRGGAVWFYMLVAEHLRRESKAPAGGSWLENRFYRRYLAWLETPFVFYWPLIVHLFGWHGTLGFHSWTAPLLYAGSFWLPHMIRAVQTRSVSALFRKDVLWLTAGTAAIGLFVPIFGLLHSTTLLAVGAFTLMHLFDNWNTADIATKVPRPLTTAERHEKARRHGVTPFAVMIPNEAVKATRSEFLSAAATVAGSILVALFGKRLNDRQWRKWLAPGAITDERIMDTLDEMAQALMREGEPQAGAAQGMLKDFRRRWSQDAASVRNVGALAAIQIGPDQRPQLVLNFAAVQKFLEEARAALTVDASLSEAITDFLKSILVGESVQFADPTPLRRLEEVNRYARRLLGRADAPQDDVKLAVRARLSFQLELETRAALAKFRYLRLRHWTQAKLFDLDRQVNTATPFFRQGLNILVSLTQHDSLESMAHETPTLIHDMKTTLWRVLIEPQRNRDLWLRQLTSQAGSWEILERRAFLLNGTIIPLRQPEGRRPAFFFLYDSYYFSKDIVQYLRERYGKNDSARLPDSPHGFTLHDLRTFVIARLALLFSPRRLTRRELFTGA